MHTGPLRNTQSMEEAKPEMVLRYNTTKGGVDNLDKLARGYSSKGKCRRWPYSDGFALVDVGVTLTSDWLWLTSELRTDGNAVGL